MSFHCATSVFRKLTRKQIFSGKRFLNNGTHDPRTVLLCSGQGAQYVGMLKKSYLRWQKAKELVQMASDICGRDLMKLCINGPSKQLDKTINCQVLTVLSSLVAAEILKDMDKSQSKNMPCCIAGYSVGELSALALAKAISYEDAFTLVKARAKAMQHASDLVPSGMLFVQGLGLHEIHDVCRKARKECSLTNKDTVCQVAIEAFEKGYAVGGTSDCLECVAVEAMKKGLSANQIAVSGAFHTSLMEPAKEEYQKALTNVEFRAPVTTVPSNVTGLPYKTVEDIPSLLLEQLVKPVKWKKMIDNLATETNNLVFYELGPGVQLKPMIGRINRRLLRNYTNVSV